MRRDHGGAPARKLRPRGSGREASCVSSFWLRNHGFVTVYNDTSKPDSYQSMIDTVVAAEGRIDGLVNNFGGTNPAEDKDLLSTSYEHFLAGVDANVGSVFLGCQAAAREMAKTGGGVLPRRRERCHHRPTHRGGRRLRPGHAHLRRRYGRRRGTIGCCLPQRAHIQRRGQLQPSAFQRAWRRLASSKTKGPAAYCLRDPARLCGATGREARAAVSRIVRRGSPRIRR
ncbi:SDR family oxidoreductase [Slackia isoflavoniconvertens]|uniref:SDR family oxidoreductase n=1 Tax=Slackia isoflavoniconvertens TaxID=572010 RepID=UPI003AAB1F43